MVLRNIRNLLTGVAPQLNIAAISSPLGKERPCGEDIRSDSKYKEIYYKIKDARNLARSAERGITPDEGIRLSP